MDIPNYFSERSSPYEMKIKSINDIHLGDYLLKRLYVKTLGYITSYYKIIAKKIDSITILYPSYESLMYSPLVLTPKLHTYNNTIWFINKKLACYFKEFIPNRYLNTRGMEQGIGFISRQTHED